MGEKEDIMNETTKTDVKSAARETIDLLPDDTTWDDVIYRMYVRQKIEAGLADAEAGNLVSTDEVRRRLGLRDEG
jgi:predicted transcriptional regulator